MEDGKIAADDLLSADASKRFEDLNSKLLVVIKTMSDLSQTAIELDKNLKAQGLTAKDLADKTTSVNNSKKKLTDAEKEVIKIEQLQQKILDSEADSIEQLVAKNKLLVLQRNKVTTTTKDGQKAASDYNKEIDKNTSKIKDNSSATEKQRMNIGNYKSALEAMPGPFNSFTSGIGGMTKAALAFIATRIGAILLILAGIIKAVSAAFTESEEGQNKLTKITTVLSAVFHGLVEVLASVGNALIAAVTEPKKAWQGFKDMMSDFGDFFKNSFGKSFSGSMKVIAGNFDATIANMKLSWAKLKNVFTDNSEAIKKAEVDYIYAMNKIALGGLEIKQADEAFRKAWDTIKGKVSDFIDEEKRRAELAAKWADMDAQRRKDERDDLIYFAQLQGKINQLRADAEAKKKSDAEASIALMEHAMKLEEEKLQDSLSDAKRDAEMWKLKGEFEKKDIAYLDELAKLNADVYNAEAAFSEARRANLKQLNRLRVEAFSQEKERIKTITDGNKAELDSTIAKNADIISNENSAYRQRISAASENSFIKMKLIEDESSLQAREVRKNFQFNLITEKDAQDQLEKIRKEKGKKEVDLAMSTDNELKSIRAKRLSDMDREADNEANKLTDLYLQKKIDAQQLSDGLLDIQIKQVEAELALADLSYSQQVSLETKLNNLKMSLMDKELKKREEVTKAAQNLANGLFEFGTQMRDAELDQIDYEKEQKIKAAGDNARAKERIEKEYATKEAAIKRKQAIADKIQALFNAAVNTAVAITAAAKTPLLIPWITALGALQIATIAAKPIPKFAKGVRGFEGGEAIVGDAGKELLKLPNGQVFLTPDVATRMLLPKGTDVFTHNETERILQGNATAQGMDELIKEQRKTRAALSNKIENHLNITPDGWKYTQKKVNQNVEFVDKYFRA